MSRFEEQRVWEPGRGPASETGWRANASWLNPNTGFLWVARAKLGDGLDQIGAGSFCPLKTRNDAKGRGSMNIKSNGNFGFP